MLNSMPTIWNNHKTTWRIRYFGKVDLFFLENGNTNEKRFILSLHKIHAVPFPEEDMEEKMNSWVRKEFNMFNEEAWLFDLKLERFMTQENHGLDFMEQIFMMIENDKLDSFSEADFKYLNKNDIEDMYYLFQNKKLGIESYQIKINLTAPTLIFSGIEACDPYFIVDESRLGLIYLNNKEEKRVMDFFEIVKLCDATLERVLKKVKLKIFKTGFLKKASLLGELDLKIMNTYEKEITKCLRHREQMRRWELFMNGRPIISIMKHQ
nr:hypothetical protein [Tanacetum cinerariifolium]